MAEKIVSVKMPASLVRELRSLTAEHHYLDLSEQVRSIVRQKCIKYSSPHHELKELREALEQKGGQLSKEQLLQELARLLKEGGA